MISRRAPRRALVAFLWAALASLSCRERPIDLDRLLELHAAARGGREALEGVASLRAEIHIVEPGSEVDLVYQAARPGLARVDVSAVGGGVVFTEAVNEAGAWQQSAGGAPEPSSPEGTAALRRGAIGNLYGLHELGGLGYRLALLEREEIDGAVYYPVEVSDPDGRMEHHYIDAASYLVTRQRDVHSLHPDVDPARRRIETRHSDFRTIDGIVRPFRSVSVDLGTGEEVQTIEVRRVIVNPAVDPSIFASPAPPAGTAIPDEGKAPGAEAIRGRTADAGRAAPADRAAEAGGASSAKGETGGGMASADRAASADRPTDAGGPAWDLEYVDLLKNASVPPEGWLASWLGSHAQPPIAEVLSRWDQGPIRSAILLDQPALEGDGRVGSWFVRTEKSASFWVFIDGVQQAHGLPALFDAALYDSLIDRLRTLEQGPPLGPGEGPTTQMEGYFAFLNIYEDGASRQLLLTFRDFFEPRDGDWSRSSEGRILEAIGPVLKEMERLLGPS
jgi:hypothetical protein